MTCPNCGYDNPPGQKFCGECGTAMQATCVSCGTLNPPGQKFCGECGTPLAAQPAAATVPREVAAPAAERRLVSVLFADLVGFTTASEHRDAEDTRELLTRYFETARTIIGRYGGTVEKFIGDAVMAVWGTPVTQEDDAERAVRAALELVSAVPELDPALEARAGVLTGEAAVTLGAEGQGMVAGDLVNTASRIQSEAEPGMVLVGEVTRRASEAAVVYEEAGEYELKGKSAPVPLWRPVRVVASRGGEGRSVGLEAPFVGRDRELRIVKDLFHATAEESHAQLVSVVGVAGIGKSRLSWEFEKYADGLAANLWWHRGRCLAYGDGVVYWAFAEMVRGRARILEEDDSATSESKLRECLATHVPDVEERDWIEPRLLHLLGLTDRVAPDQEDLFSAWRRFVERLAEEQPVALVFEDLHWADAGLVAFIEHLLDWSRNHPIFVLTLARPELAERHPGFPGATRNATTVALEPFSEETMDELLVGLVPGLPEDVRTQIRERADGIPLYAVETVRMLLDRGLLEQEESQYRVTGALDALEVPETLHALIAARLDGLPDAERALLQNASVLGKTFTHRGLGAVSGSDEEEVELLVASLVRKEVLGIEGSPLSPERGQIGFLQALVQRVAYETLSRRDRRARHIAAGRYLATEAGIDPDEIAEVIASHYLDALEADPAADDAAETRAAARKWFVRAADRAASLASAAEAQHGFDRAAELADDDIDRAKLLLRAGELALMAGSYEDAQARLEQAISIFAEAGLVQEEAMASSKLGELLFSVRRTEDAAERMEQALAVFENTGDESAIAPVAAQLGRFLWFEGETTRAREHIDRALDIAERLRLPETISHALNSKSMMVANHPNESIALVRQALEVALEDDLGGAALRAYNNLAVSLWLAGRTSESERIAREGLAYARRRGDRYWERQFLAGLIGASYDHADWDEVERLAGELPEEGRVAANIGHAGTLMTLAEIALHRGFNEEAASLVAEQAALEPSADIQVQSVAAAARILVAMAEGRHEDAVSVAQEFFRKQRGLESTDIPAVESLLNLSCEAATAARSVDDVESLLAHGDALVEMHSPQYAAHRLRLGARVSAGRGEENPPFGRAIALLREVEEPFWVAVTLLEQAEWLVGRGRADEARAGLDEARATFERLKATPWLERLDRVAGREQVPA